MPDCREDVKLSSAANAGDDGDCMYIILKGSCNVHVDLNFDESAQAGALQKASLQPKVAKKKTAPNALPKQHLARLNSTVRLERVSSSLSSHSDSSVRSHSDSSVRSSGADRAEHKRGRSLLGKQPCPCCCAALVAPGDTRASVLHAASMTAHLT